MPRNVGGCGLAAENVEAIRRIARYVVVSGILLAKSETSKFVGSNTKKTKASAEDGLRRLLQHAEARLRGRAGVECGFALNEVHPPFCSANYLDGPKCCEINADAGGVVLYFRCSVGWNGYDGAKTPVGLEGAGVVSA